MKGGRSFDKYLKEELKDLEFRKAYEEEGIYADIAIQIAKLREKEGLTQEELAHLLHTTQQTVSRLEDPGNESLSLRTLVKLVQALHKSLRIQII